MSAQETMIPFPAMSELVDPKHVGKRKEVEITLTVWLNEEDMFEVEAETTYLHKDWHESYRKGLAAEAQSLFSEFVTDEFSE